MKSLVQQTRVGFILALAFYVSACVSTEPARSVPHINLSPQTMQFVPTAGGELAFGIDATANESDSLENLAVLPGIKVRRVRAGSAADQAGLRAGDVLLSVNGVATDTPDVLAAIANAETGAETLPVEARRGTTVFETRLPIPLERKAAGREAIAPEERYRIDPTKTRAGYRTALIRDTRSGEQLSAARIVELQAQSPLRKAGLAEGDAIIGINGEAVASAQGLIDRIHTQYDFGEAITLDVLRGNDEAFEREAVRVTLWDPGRRLSEFTVWPLVSYRSDPATQHTRFAVLDFWLFSLFAYERNDGEKEYSLLGLFTFSTGYGQLVDESGNGASR